VHPRLIQRLTAQASISSLAILAVFLPVFDGIPGGVLYVQESGEQVTFTLPIAYSVRKFRYSKSDIKQFTHPRQVSSKASSSLPSVRRSGGKDSRKDFIMCMYPSEIQRAPLTIYGRLNPNAHPTTSAPLETKLGSKTSGGRFLCHLGTTANRTQLHLDRKSVLCSNILIYTQ
jgi:hypothetical protein